MKKILLASTMLIATATIANAQAVTISGEGRMGIQALRAFGTTIWTQENRLTLDFNVAVEADHGLTFGAWSRARMSSSWPGTAGAGIFSGSRVWVESNGLRLTFGNADGAIATSGTSHGWLGGCGVGYEGGQICGDTGFLDRVAHVDNSTGANAAPQALITYSAGDYAVALSNQRGVSTEVAGRYTFGAITVAAGYSDSRVSSANDFWTISGHYDGGSWGVGALVADINNFTNWSLSGTVDVYGGHAYGYVGEIFGLNTYGLSYGYDLGGGATLTAGAEYVDVFGGVTSGSVGVAFTF